jgi:hypothetical protein
MTTPSTSVQALAPVTAQPRALAALKTSLDDLDDDDLRFIGAVANGDTPRNMVKVVGLMIGLGVVTLLTGVSAIGTAVALGGVGVWSLLGARRLMRGELVEHGLAEELATEIVAAISWTTQARSDGWRLPGNRDRRRLDCGRFVVAAVHKARARR